MLEVRAGKAKDSAIGSAMGKSDDWFKKVRNLEAGVLLTDIPKLVKALGLRLVDEGKVCVDRDVAQAMETLTRRALNRTELIWDDE